MEHALPFISNLTRIISVIVDALIIIHSSCNCQSLYFPIWYGRAQSFSAIIFMLHFIPNLICYELWSKRQEVLVVCERWMNILRLNHFIIWSAWSTVRTIWYLRAVALVLGGPFCGIGSTRLSIFWVRKWNEFVETVVDIHV